MKKLFSMFAGAALLLGIVSCSDDDNSVTPEPTTYNVTVVGGTVDGGPSFAAGATVTVTASDSASFTFVNWTYESDSTVILANENSVTTSFTMPASAVRLTANFELDSTFVDVRDNTTYRQVLMPDGNIWMAENLNFEIAGSWCHSNANQCARYGRLYTWTAAMGGELDSDVNVRGVCPAGWHLPSADEWQTLFDAFDTDEELLGTKLKSELYWMENEPDTPVGTDDFGFTALPGGEYLVESEMLVGITETGSWWTATFEEHTAEPATAVSWSLQFDSEAVSWNSTSRDGRGLSVRCVRD